MKKKNVLPELLQHRAATKQVRHDEQREIGLCWDGRPSSGRGQVDHEDTVVHNNQRWVRGFS